MPPRTLSIAPSILAADFGALGAAVRTVGAGGAGLIHGDGMDGRFVPNLTIGVPIVAALARAAAVPLDVHLMIVEPERHIEAFAKAGASMISVHLETSPHLHRTLGALRALGVRATIAMPAIAPEVKKRKTRQLGAEIVELAGGSEEDWRLAAEEMAAEHGYAMVPPFDDETIIAGAGTVGLEICEDLPQTDLVLAPIGGGGLLSGVAAAVKLGGSGARVIGVEPELAGDAKASFEQGEIVEFELAQTRRTMADGLRATRVGAVTFEHMRAFVDDVVTVSEEEIAEAMRRILLDARLVAEPSGAVAAAAWMFRRDRLPAGETAVAVVSGGNVEPDLLARILTG